MTQALFKSIGDALVANTRQFNQIPHYHTIVLLESWNDPHPVLEAWPCPANPSGGFAPGFLGPFDSDVSVSAALQHVDIRASHVPPSCSFLTDLSIGSNQSICECIFVPDYNVSQKFAANWPKLVEQPELVVDATYTITIKGKNYTTSGMANVIFLARFSAAAIDAGKRNVNAELLALPFPLVI